MFWLHLDMVLFALIFYERVHVYDYGMSTRVSYRGRNKEIIY